MTTATIASRPYAGEADLAQIADLQNACEAVDRLDAGISVEELRTELGDPRLDAQRDMRLWEDDGQLVGFGQLWRMPLPEELNGRLMLWVLPEARGNGLETQIIAWGAERLREAASEHGKPGRLRIQAREDQADRLALLQTEGFTISRYSYTMARSLDEPIAEPQIPEGFVDSRGGWPAGGRAVGRDVQPVVYRPPRQQPLGSRTGGALPGRAKLSAGSQYRGHRARRHLRRVLLVGDLRGAERAERAACGRDRPAWHPARLPQAGPGPRAAARRATPDQGRWHGHGPAWRDRQQPDRRASAL